MRTLPEALQMIDVPDRFAASSLGGWTACVAKLALASQRLSPALAPLPGGPAAVKGTLAHRVIEQWIKGEGPDEPEELFAHAYQRLREELKADSSRAAFAELAEVFGAADWSGFRAWVLARCEASGRVPVGRQSGQAPDRGDRIRLTGVEVPLRSETLRLTGKADRIRQLAAETYEIRDFKSGAVLNDEGGVTEAVALQLQAYGLMFLEARPGAQLVLVVDIGRDIPVAFDAEVRASARERIETLLAPVPAASRQSMDRLATPGADCLGCRVRHLCSGYLAQAPSWWLAYPDTSARISYDNWGLIAAVIGRADGIDVTLEDAAGRRVRIDRLERRHGLTSSHLGRALWLFDLESPGPGRNFKGQRYHPRVFHELPRDRRERRAWGAQVFLGPDGAEALHPGGNDTPCV